MTTALSVNGKDVSLQRLWRPDMSLSSAKAGRQAASYTLTADKAVVLQILSRAYEGCVRGLKDDDRITGSTDFFGRAGYPPLESLRHQPELLSRVVRTYFEEELLAALLLPPPPSLSGTYAVDGVSSVRYEEERFVVEGTCYAF